LKILAISTAEKECSIALVEGANPVCEEMWSAKQTHSKRIMGMVDQIMDRASMSISELDGFAVAKGPGSFTGLRIGISTIKGLAYALSKPCAGISSLDGIAWQLSFSSLPVCVIMDAQRGEVYHATYNFHNGKLIEKSQEKALKPLEVLKLLDKDTLFVGSGAIAYQEIINKEFDKKAKFAPLFQSRVRASALAQVLFQKPSILNDNETNINSVIPEYLRKSDAEISKK
jgi:tRNA threonylcarbamoyladenosine biosynthesis protein TsaB